MWLLEPSLAGLLDVIHRDRLDGLHTALVVVIAETRGAKLNPPFSPLRAGLPCLSHLAYELGTGKG